jgi:hypothetical protein
MSQERFGKKSTVLTNEKGGEMKVLSRFKLFTCMCRSHPVRGLKPLSEGCFYFENNNCIQLTALCQSLMKNPGILHAMCSIQTTLFVFSDDPNIAGICCVD